MVESYQTEFERTVRTLGLTGKDWAKSEALRKWVARRKEQRYVPEELLRQYGMTVRATFSPGMCR